MAKTSMTATTFFGMAKSLPVDITVLLRAERGVGKSQMIAQLADYFREKDYGGKGFPLIDRRLSQMSDGDVLGLPFTDGRITVFNLPEWVQQACDEPVCLFLDEINRATQEVMNAAFEIVLDRSIQGRKLHPGTRVYSAINTGASYIVNEMDPALLDRFWAIDLEPTIEEWLEWARTNPDMIDLVRGYIRMNEKFLDPPKECESGHVTTSRRSWHRLSRSLKYAGLQESPEDPAFYAMSLGFIGTEAALSFVDYAKTVEKQIAGEDVLNKLVKKLATTEPQYCGRPKDDENSSGDKKEYDDAIYDEKLIERIKELGQERCVGLTEKVIDAVTKALATSPKKCLTEKQGTAIGKFISIIPAELRINLFSKLLEQGTNNVDLIKIVHKYSVGWVLNVFGIPLNSDGSVQPNIPDFLKKD
jgi:hypothetical protein